MREVGQKCSLMPDMDSPDSSDQVQGLVTGLRGSDKEEGLSLIVHPLPLLISCLVILAFFGYILVWMNAIPCIIHLLHVFKTCLGIILPLED